MSIYWYNNGMKQHMPTNVWPEKPLHVKTKPGRISGILCSPKYESLNDLRS